MIVSFSKKFIFIKTPKCAGTSIQRSILPILSGGDICAYGHKNEVNGKTLKNISEFSKPKDVENHLNIKFDDFFSFGFVRNPFGIVLSRFFYQIKRKRIDFEPTVRDFNRWVQRVYYFNYEYPVDRPLAYLFDYELNLIVDFIGRVEHIESNFEFLCDRVFKCDVELLHINRSDCPDAHYHDWFNSESRRLIQKCFEFELDFFKYSF